MREGWTETTLGEVAEINPETVKGLHTNHSIRYIDLSSVDSEFGISADLPVYELKDAPGRAKRVVREGDVLVATVRPYLRGFAQVPKHLDGEVASTGFAVLRATPNALPGFIWGLVRRQPFVDHLMTRATGSNYPAVRPDDVGAFPISVRRDVWRCCGLRLRCHR
jgi:type I restriction enzyme S subunit